MRDSLKTAFKRAIINCSKFLTASFKEGDLRKGSFYPLSGVSEINGHIICFLISLRAKRVAPIYEGMEKGKGADSLWPCIIFTNVRVFRYGNEKGRFFKGQRTRAYVKYCSPHILG